MPKLNEYLRIREAGEYPGVCQNTLRLWDAGGKITVSRHPWNSYRLHKVHDSERLLKRAERVAAHTRTRRGKRHSTTVTGHGRR